MRVRRSCNRVASRGASVRNSTPHCSVAAHRTRATPTSMGVWFGPGKISTWRESPFWTGVGLQMAHPSRDRLMAVPLHSGPSAEHEEVNATGTRRHFRSSLRVSRGDEETVGGFDGILECMNTNVRVLNRTSKLFLVMGAWCQRSSSFSTRAHFPFGSNPSRSPTDRPVSEWPQFPFGGRITPPSGSE